MSMSPESGPWVGVAVSVSSELSFPLSPSELSFPPPPPEFESSGVGVPSVPVHPANIPTPASPVVAISLRRETPSVCSVIGYIVTDFK
jgi:hypothetical protein